jgi:hypothetical protein
LLKYRKIPSHWELRILQDLLRKFDGSVSKRSNSFIIKFIADALMKLLYISNYIKMISTIFIVLAVLLCSINSAFAYTNATVGTGLCGYDATCSVGGVSGVCVSISAGCCSTGTVTSNLCPGSSDIKCCTNNKCSTPYGSGTCMQTSLCSSQGGSSYSGYWLV